MRGPMILVMAVIVGMMMGAVPVWADEAKDKPADTCTLPKRWDPAEYLPQILKEHQAWVEKKGWTNPAVPGRANLT